MWSISSQNSPLQKCCKRREKHFVCPRMRSPLRESFLPGAYFYWRDTQEDDWVKTWRWSAVSAGRARGLLPFPSNIVPFQIHSSSLGGVQLSRAAKTLELESKYTFQTSGKKKKDGEDFAFKLSRDISGNKPPSACFFKNHCAKCTEEEMLTVACLPPQKHV